MSPSRCGSGGPGSIPVASFATDRASGFTDEDVADLRRLVDMMAPIAEIYIYRNIAETVTDTYLGHIVGEQILGGLIKRGDGREINAVLWFSDLRDFTGLNERMAAADLLELLNNYLQLVGDALKTYGGEILKFIGDGVMAYFPAEDALFLPMVTNNAIGAARRLIDDIESANEARATGGARSGALRRRPACRAGDVRQYRHGGPARLHGHRARRQSRGAARGPDQGARRADPRFGRVQRRQHHPAEVARQAHAARRARAGRGVHAAGLADVHRVQGRRAVGAVL